MRVVVAGGTGFIGTNLCTELDQRGHDVVALARDPTGAGLPDGVITKAADVTDRDSLDGPIAGADAVVNLVSLSPLFKPDGGDEMHDRVHRRGTEHLLDAAAEADVDRFVQMSGLGADPDAPTHFLRAKGRADETVRESELEHVIVRPSVVFGDGDEFVYFTKRLKEIFAPGVPLYPLPGGGRNRFQPIWVGDLVPMLADAVVDAEHADRTYEFGGPDVLTLREISELVFESEGRSITVVPLPMGLAKVGLTVLGSVGFPMGRDQYRSLRIDNVVSDNDVGAFGVAEADLKSFEEYLGLATETTDAADSTVTA
ncbi:complex I NDUFA9 subunit family protein [Halobaculum magnesiiphilum]|uniref:Complex I NDUFA9 subunit family protein n=1 Tax=Halobaculum magnesiiphilum TaxID=1017351 RepID=A0A8T8WG08_9EURY|nr:complex I NDUFA9 subunit family protein [Halobaculum magnesiiphilum]QZP38778.1 complex I NDUFA9 subunit family protein [Halobaculum magnesiiphilum]